MSHKNFQVEIYPSFFARESSPCFTVRAVCGETRTSMRTKLGFVWRQLYFFTICRIRMVILRRIFKQLPHMSSATPLLPVMTLSCQSCR